MAGFKQRVRSKRLLANKLTYALQQIAILSVSLGHERITNNLAGTEGRVTEHPLFMVTIRTQTFQSMYSKLLTNRAWRARTKRDLIIEIWEVLDSQSIGGAELEVIQKALCERFGTGAAESPAAIARTLAEEGATLRHPEVLTFDSQWREGRLEKIGIEMRCSTIKEAIATVQELSARRKELLNEDHVDAQLIKDFAVTLKQEAEALSRSAVLDLNERQIAREFSRWLTIWIQDPDLFDEWLKLRQRSPEFQDQFGLELVAEEVDE